MGDCKFQDEAKAFAAALKTCRNKFSECRKYEDDAAHTISACSKNSDDLLKKVAALSANADKVKEAQAVVKALASGRSGRRSRRAAALTSCTEVKTVAIQLTAFVLEFPGAPDILVYSAKIIASSSVVCTAAEKTALAEVDAAFDEAVSYLDDAVEAAHDELMELTGTTPHADVVAAAAATADSADSGDSTTPAPGDTTPPADGADDGQTLPADGTTPAPGDTTPPADGADDGSTPPDDGTSPAPGDSTPAPGDTTPPADGADDGSTPPD